MDYKKLTKIADNTDFNESADTDALTAYYNGKEYTVDDELPYEAKISIKYKNEPYAYNAYPNRGESLRDWVESRGESMDDIIEWWMD